MGLKLIYYKISNIIALNLLVFISTALVSMRAAVCNKFRTIWGRIPTVAVHAKFAFPTKY